MTNRKLTILTFLAALVLNSAAAVSAVEPQFPLGKETTYVDGPLDAEGYVDYAGALNAHYGRGVTPDENANALLWKACGPSAVDAAIRDKYFAALGMPVPPSDGKYYVTQADFLKGLSAEVRATVTDDAREAHLSRPWTAKEFPQLAAWLALNERPLSLIARAAEREKFFEPIVVKPNHGGAELLLATMSPSISLWRDATRALAARALLRIAEKRFDDARRDLLAVHRIARLTARGPGTIALLFGVSIEATACHAAAAYLEHADPTHEQLRSYEQALDGLPPFPEIAEKIELAERFGYLEVLQRLKRHGFSGIDENAVDAKSIIGGMSNGLAMTCDYTLALRKANRWYDRLADCAREQDFTKQSGKFDALESDLKQMMRRDEWGKASLAVQFVVGSPAVKGELLGDLFLPMFSSTVTILPSVVNQATQRMTNVRAALALAAYKRETGRYPTKLDDLAPKYLSKVPDDLFGKGPLKYRATSDGYLLYSVGLSGGDDDGRAYDDEPPGDDLRIRIPYVAPLKNEVRERR